MTQNEQYNENLEIKNFIEIHSTTIQNNELDIYIPELNVAFEFNGLWWHNELYKEKNYHLKKTEECEKQGIQLVQIWEDDWIRSKRWLNL